MTDTPWWERSLIALDTETTGPNPETAGIVTAHVSLVRPSGANAGRTLVIDPGVPIPDGAAAVHGYTTERIRDEGMPRTFGIGALYGLLRRLIAAGHPIVAYNAAYDCTVIDRELARAHPNLRPLSWRPVIDPFVLDKATDRYRRGKRTLTDTCRLYGVELADAHEASSDALAAVALARAIGRKYGGQPSEDWSPLGAGEAGPPVVVGDPGEQHDVLISARAEQCDSLRAYFDRQGIEHDGVPGAWPMHPRPLTGVRPLDGSDDAAPA